MREVIEASTAVAIAAKLCRPKVIGAYPITPQTHIMERIADFVYDGDFDAELIDVESEHSAISACLGAQATGVRTFTATASQGLALMHEILFVVSGMRLPVVMAVANRTLSAPINIWNDHQDSISARDSGWLQFYVESSQEALDTVIMAYKIAENKDILMPAMVCLDGFTLSHVYEPVDIPEQKKVDSFLPKYNPLFKLDPSKPVTMGPVAFPDSFMEFKKEQQKAMLKSIEIIKNVNKDFKKKFNRSYGDGLIETYKMEDAKYAVLTIGSICGTARVVIDELRKKGKRVGLIKLRCLRPFPEKELLNAAKKLEGIAVIDRNISLGKEGAVFTEVKSVLQNKKTIRKTKGFSVVPETTSLSITGFIAGLGGRDVTKEHIEKAILSIGKEGGWLS